MKVSDVIEKCGELLEVGYTKEALVDCFNIIEQELALDYLPLYATHLCNSNTVEFSEFKYNPIQIVGCNCSFKVHPTYVASKETITSIRYAYAPDKKGIHDKCSYGDEFLMCLAYGTVAEYLLSQGFFEESALWDKKYKVAIQSLTL